MLERYDGKLVRITSTDGSVFAGEADFCPSGYGLHEFGRAEESLSLGDVQIFLSDIEKIEVAAEDDAEDNHSGAGAAEKCFGAIAADKYSGPAAVKKNGSGAGAAEKCSGAEAATEEHPEAASVGTDPDSLNAGDLLTDPKTGELMPRQFDDQMGELLEGPYWIADILPEQVPGQSAGQYFTVDRYFRQPERLSCLYRQFAELLLKLNCYSDMAVTFDSCMHWERNPSPELFANRVEQLANRREQLSGNEFLRVMFPAEGVMIDLDPGDTYLTIYDPKSLLLGRIRRLTAVAGLFLWQGED